MLLGLRLSPASLRFRSSQDFPTFQIFHTRRVSVCIHAAPRCDRFLFTRRPNDFPFRLGSSFSGSSSAVCYNQERSGGERLRRQSYTKQNKMGHSRVGSDSTPLVHFTKQRDRSNAYMEGRGEVDKITPPFKSQIRHCRPSPPARSYHSKRGGMRPSQLRSQKRNTRANMHTQFKKKKHEQKTRPQDSQKTRQKTNARKQKREPEQKNTGAASSHVMNLTPPPPLNHSTKPTTIRDGLCPTRGRWLFLTTEPQRLDERTYLRSTPNEATQTCRQGRNTPLKQRRDCGHRLTGEPSQLGLVGKGQHRSIHPKPAARKRHRSIGVCEP